MNHIREEFFELIKESKTRWFNGGGLTISTVLAIIVGIQGKPYLLVTTLYTVLVLFILLNSFYVLSARKKINSIIRTSTSSDQETEVPKYPSLRPLGIGGIILSIVLAVFFAFVHPVNKQVTYVIFGTPTLTPTPTMPPATATATHPVSDDIHYAIILDASESMNATFDGQNKWSIALQTADSIIDGSNANAHYALFAAGGSGPNQSPDPCLNPSRSDVPFGSRDAVRNYLTQLQPKGGGSFKDAFNLAKAELQNLPREAIGTIVFITSTEDSCKGENVWREDLKYAIQDLDTIKIRGEIVLLDDNGARTQEIAEFMNNLSENVNVQAPQNIQILNNITINNIVVNINNFIQIEATARAPESHNPPPPLTIITETFTPDSHPPSNPASPNSTSTSTPTPSKTATATLTSTSTPTSTVTPSPTLWPGIVNIISPGNGASFGCPDNQDCIIPVIVQWIPDTQAAAQGLYLSIWVKPYPGDTNYLFYSQSSPTYLGNGLWQSTPVYLGGATDLAGTPFEIYAIVTNQFYPTGMQTSPLPNNSGESVISVAR